MAAIKRCTDCGVTLETHWIWCKDEDLIKWTKFLMNKLQRVVNEDPEIVNEIKELLTEVSCQKQ